MQDKKVEGARIMSAKPFNRGLFPMQRTQVFIVLAVLYAALDARPTYAKGIYRANPTPPTDGRVGANYTPDYAVNQIQFWHDFRPKVIDRELAAAKRYFGISTLRVYLHCINFEQEKNVFLANFETFLTICDRYEIKPGFVFFDDCHRADGIFLDEPTSPIKGYHNGRWAWSPQKRHRDPNNLERFRPYVQEVIKRHKTDERVLFWEIFNEPNLRNAYSARLRQLGYAWAKDIGPVSSR
jgi:hypothetical protein